MIIARGSQKVSIFGTQSKSCNAWVQPCANTTGLFITSLSVCGMAYRHDKTMYKCIIPCTMCSGVVRATHTSVPLSSSSPSWELPPRRAAD